MSGGLAIALAGGAGSGKSTIAAELAKRLNGRAVGFGDYIRHLASTMGRPIDRGSLQQIGQEHAEQGSEIFVANFLDWARLASGQDVVIDGVRHASVDQALRAWASSNGRYYALILLDASMDLRAERQFDGNQEAIHHLDAHPVERETRHTLPMIADLVVSAEGSPEEIVARIAASDLAPLTRCLINKDHLPDFT